MYTFSEDVLALNPQLRELSHNKPSKYRNIPTCIDDHRFASKKEAGHYLQLRILRDAGQIVNLKLQPRFPLAEGVTYVADFMWEDTHTGKTHVLDSKGFRTKEYKIKARLFVAKYPDYIYEVR